MEKKRLIGLDVFRVLAAIVIFLFHSRTGMEYHYGVLQPFLRMGAIFMTGFFMMSGFCLYLSSHKKSLMKLSDMVQFYVKRFIGIMPIYYVAALLYIVLLGKETVLENVILAPIELLGLQATMQSMFQLSHNIGNILLSLCICIIITIILHEAVEKPLKRLCMSMYNRWVQKSFNAKAD